MQLTGKLYIVEKKYSNYGNPQYTCLLVDDSDNTTTFYTKANSGLASYVSNYKNKKVTVDLIIKKDKIILTAIDLVG